MGYSKYQQNAVEEQQLIRNEQPWFYVFIPQTAVAVGATSIVVETVSTRNFMWTDIGFTTDAVFAPAFAFPNVGVPFRVSIHDVHGQKYFSNVRIDLTALTGSNPQWNDKGMYRMPRGWPFAFNTNIEVEFLNIGLVAATPTLIMGGFLYDSAKG